MINVMTGSKNIALTFGLIAVFWGRGWWKTA
jgi:hypothetical protein